MTAINAETLVAASGTALGPGGWSSTTWTLIGDGATLALQGGVSLDEHMHLLGTGVGGLGALRSISGNNALTMTYGGSGSGPGFGLDGNTTIGVDADTFTVTGFYHDSGSFGISKAGAGTLVLSQASAYTGGTTINAGTLALSGAGNIGSSPTITMVAGTMLDVSGVTGGFSLSSIQTLTGSGTVTGNAAAAAGSIIVPGGSGYGTFTFANDLTLNGQPFTLDLSSSSAGSNDRINIVGALSLNGNSVLSLNYMDGQLNAGTYTLMTYASHGGGTFSLDRPYSNVTLVDAGTALTLVVSDTSYLGNANLVWAGDGVSNLWSVGGALNWTINGTDRFTFDDGDTVSFTGTGSNNPDLSVSGTVQPASVAVTGSKTYTLAGGGQLGGSGTLTVNAPGGGLVLNNDAAYSGDTTISAGTLTLKGGYVSANFSIASGAVLELNAVSGTRDYSQNTVLSGSGTLRKTGSGGVIWGPAATTFNLGSGSLIDIQAGAFTGGSYANETWSSCLADLTVAAGASFGGVEANVRVNVLRGDGTITSGYPGAGYSQFTFGVNNGSGSFGGALADGASPGNFVKTGSGTQSLTGPSTYSGSTTMSGGKLAVTNGGSLYTTLGGGHASVVIAAGATLEVDQWGDGGSLGQLNYTKNNLQISGGSLRYTGSSNGHVLDDGPGFTIGAGGGTLDAATVGQTWFINYDGRSDYLIDRTAGTLTLTGAGNGQMDKVIPGSGSLVKTGSGRWTLAATNTLSGGITITQGTLALANTSAIALSPSVHLASGATCDVAAATGFALVAGQTLSGFGTVGGDLARVGGSAIVPGTAGSAGTLRFLNALTLQDPTNSYDLSSNPGGSNDRIIVGDTVTLGSDTFVHLNYTDGVLGEGVYTVMTFAAKSGAGGFYLDGPSYNNVTLDDTSPTQLLVVVGAGGSQLGAAQLVWSGDGLTNTWEVAGALNWKASGPQRFQFSDNDQVTFDGTGSTSPSVNVNGDVSPSSVRVTGSQTYTLGGGGRLTGTNSLTVNASGGLNISARADYTGPTAVSAGTLTLNNTTGFASAVSISAAGILELGGSSSWSLNASALANSGLIRKFGAGIVSFSTGGSFGNVTISDGTLRPTSNGVTVLMNTLSVHEQATNDLFGANLSVNFLSGTGAVVNTGAGASIVTIGSSGGSGTFNGSIGGGASIALVKSGAGTLTLAGSSTYGGGTTLNSGTVILANSGALGGSGTISFGGGTLQFSTLNTNDYSPRFSGSAGQRFKLNTAGQDVSMATGLGGTDSSLTKLGLGTLTLGGANGYSGSTLISAGTLKLGAAATLASTSITVSASTTFNVADPGGFSSSAALIGNGLVASAYHAASGATVHPGADAAAGTLSFTGNLSFAGTAACHFDLAQANDVGGGINDLIAIQGDLNAGNAQLVVANLNNAQPMTAGDYILFTYTGTLTGTFNPAVICPYPATIDYSVPGEVRLSIACEEGGSAPIIVAAPRSTFTVNSLSSVSVSATDPGCVEPVLSVAGLPSGANFTTSVSGDGNTRNGTFTWSPAPGQQGTYPLRVTASDGTLSSSTNILFYVRSPGESTNSQGVPLSQTNWHVVITNIDLPTSGNATVVWNSVNGITYDVYTSTNDYGSQTMTWTKEVNGVMAGGTQQDSTVASSGQKYVQVVPSSFPPQNANLWAIIKPVITPGFTMFSAPLTGSDLKFSGAFGTNLAAVLTGDNGGVGDYSGDEVFILNPDASYSNLYLDASGVWRTSAGEVATHQLIPGQGIIILRNSLTDARPRFSGPVGNTLARTNTIAVGTTILTFSEGKHLTPAAAFTNLIQGTPVGSYDEDAADQIIFLDPNASFRPVQRLPDGTWLDLTTFGSAGHLFTPGSAAFYIRRTSGGTMQVKF